MISIIKNKSISIAFLILCISLYITFFEYVPTFEILFVSQVVIFPFLLFFSFPAIYKTSDLTSLAAKILLLSFILSCFSAIFIWKQSIIETVRAFVPYSGILIYFYLVSSKMKFSTTLKVLLSFGLVYLILFCFQLIHGSEALFGPWGTLEIVRGVMRIIFPGEGFFFFLYVYLLASLNRNRKLVILAMFLFVNVVMLLQVTRIYILAFSLVTVYHFLIKSKMWIRVSAISVLILLFASISFTDNAIYKGIQESNNQDLKEKNDYIRFQATDYYLNQFSNTVWTKIIGNGPPHHSSNYGKKIFNASEEDRFFLDDLGIIGGYFLFGVLFVAAYLFIFIYVYRVPIPIEKIYLKYYFFVIFVMSFTTRALTNNSIVVPTAIVLYLIYKERRNQKLNKLVWTLSNVNSNSN